jgi:hypothetical protein
MCLGLLSLVRSDPRFVSIEVSHIFLSHKTENPHLILSTTMNSIKYACILNNKGVDLLVSGNSSSAVRSLKGAMRIFKKAVNGTTSCTGMNLSSEDDTLPFCESAFAVPGLHDMHFFTYDHGIMLTTNEESDEMLPIYSAVVLFNLALASHHQGRLHGHEKSLKHASLLYGVAVKILSGSSMMNNMSTTILTLLALNNQSQIYDDQCEHIQSVDCLKAVSKIMESVEVLHFIISQEHLRGLLLNTMLLIVPTAAAAA